MKTITLKIENNINDKFLWLLEHFSKNEISNDTGSMIEDVEMGSGCVADMHKSEVAPVSQQELLLNDILNSKMLDKAKELFDIKKITVKSRS